MGCGHLLGSGRFCVECGRPVDGERWSTDTAERPVVPSLTPSAAAPTIPVPPPPIAPESGPMTPKPVPEPPHQPRFPLFADEVGPGGLSPAAAPGPAPEGPRPERAWLPWLAGAVALVLVAAVGTVLLVGGDDEPSQADETTGPQPTPQSARRTASPSPDPSPKTKPSRTAQPSKPAGPSEDVTATTTATVPTTAPRNTDVDGNPVSYHPTNMLDGVATTCWRMPGDGTGSAVVLTLAEPTTLTRIGLVNGYAKTSQDGGKTFDWYRGNRRLLAVEWTFDDGTRISQSLEEVRRPQTVDIPPVTTKTVTLSLVDVSPPGTGRSGRDYTAISDLTLKGSPAT